MCTATSALIIFPLALFTVALPLAEDNSGKRTSEIISPLVDEKTYVVSHGKEYSGSLVFYSGAKVFRLETQANYELLRPQALTWSSKNVMPFMTFDELPSDKTILAIVAVDAEKIFFDNVSGDWELVGTVPKGNLETFAEEFFLGKTSEQKLKCKIYRRSMEGL